MKANLLLGVGYLTLACWLSSITVSTTRRQPVPYNVIGTHRKAIQSLKHQTRVVSRPVHFIFRRASHKMVVYTSKGYLLFSCEAKNRCINNWFWHYGKIPDGTYKLGKTVRVGNRAFGPYAIPILDSADRLLHRYHRRGIYLHGGGSKLSNPFADYQELVITHGCVRVHNKDLVELVRVNHQARLIGSYVQLSICK